MGVIKNGHAFQASDLNGLSQPLHLFEYVTRSQHYHFGYFETPEACLGEAMERMAERTAAHFGRHRRILDVGCALGGTSRLLAGHGFDVVGIDPSPEAIDYARARSTEGIQFFCECLADFARRSDQPPFDGIVLIEVLQYFASLEELFAGCQQVLRQGGLVVVNDVVKSTDENLAWVPYHERGELQRQGRAAGFEVVENEDVSARITPTLPRLTEALRGERGEIERFFSSEQRRVSGELDELLDQIDLLRQGFAGEHLAYETTVLRYSG